ncbi:MAG: hypothetical protein ACJA1L_001899, partial [Paracoccaceae bacterium]
AALMSDGHWTGIGSNLVHGPDLASEADGLCKVKG